MGQHTAKSLTFFAFVVYALLSANDSWADVSTFYTSPLDPPGGNKSSLVPADTRLSGEGSDIFESGLLFFKEGDYPSAISRWSLVLKKYPRSQAGEASAFLIGEAHDAYAESKREAKPTLTRPTDTLQEKAGESEWLKALNAFQKAIHEYPDSVWVPAGLYRLGDVYRKLGLLVEARGTFQRILQEFPGNPYGSKSVIGIAASFFQEGKFKDSTLAFQQVLRKYPNSEEARTAVYGTADSLFSLREFGEAQKFYEAGLRKWPGYLKAHPDSLFRYGEAAFQNGEWKKARAAFFTLFNLYPSHDHAGIAMNRIGDTYRLEGRTVLAGGLYEAVISFYPSGDAALLAKIALGELKEREAQSLDHRPVDQVAAYETAINYFRNVSSAGNRLAGEAFLRMGRMMEHRGASEQALQIYETLLETELPDHVDPILGVSPNHSKEEAVRSVSRILDDRMQTVVQRQDDLALVFLFHRHQKFFLTFIPDIPRLQPIAEAHRRVGLFREALPLYQAMLTTAGKERESLLFDEGETYVLAGEMKAAEQTLKAYRILYPKGASVERAGHLILKALYRQKDLHGVIAFAAAEDLVTDGGPEATRMIAESYLQTGKKEKARELLQRAVAAGPRGSSGSQGPIYLTLGNIAMEEGSYEEALDNYRRGLQVAADIDDREYLELMAGRCLVRLGRTDEANEVFSDLAAGSSNMVKQVVTAWGEELRDGADHVSAQ